MVKLIKEFLVIVSGVLVALVLESAWQDWMDQRLVGNYIQRLQEEVEFNLAELELDRRWTGVGCESGQSAYDALWDEEIESSTQPVLLLDLFVTALNREPLYRTTTYQDLVSTGRLSLIGDSKLREQIISFYEGREAQEVWRPKLDNPYRKIVLQTLPPEWAIETADCITDGQAEYEPDWKQCRVEPANGHEAVIAELRVRPQLRDHLSNRVYWMCNYPRFLDRSREELIELQSALGGYSDAARDG